MIVDGDWLRDSRLEDGPSLGRLISVSVTVLVSQWLTGLLYHHILSSLDWPECVLCCYTAWSQDVREEVER